MLDARRPSRAPRAADRRTASCRSRTDPHGTPAAVEPLDPVLPRLRAQPVREQRLQLVVSRHALPVGREALVQRELRDARRTCATDRRCRPPARSRRPTPRTSRTARCVGCRLPMRAGADAGGEVDCRPDSVSSAATESSIAMSTCWPRPVRSRANSANAIALRREHAGDDVGDRHAEPERRAVGGAGDAHQAAFGLHHRVVARLAAAAVRSGRSRRSSSRPAADASSRASRSRARASPACPAGSSRRARRSARSGGRGSRAPRAA